MVMAPSLVVIHSGIFTGELDLSAASVVAPSLEPDVEHFMGQSIRASTVGTI